jgi:Icc-related predicted phosphoesterase
MRFWAIGFAFLVLLSSCKKFIKYNANEIRLDEKYRNLNPKNIDNLKSKAPKDSFRFIVISDSQRSYDELDDFVKKANSYDDISFVVLNGDITDFGLPNEYLWITERMQKLSFPFIVVIGNHDMLGNGREIYKQMFGPENFSFSYSGYRFIFSNSNSREATRNELLPDTSWLKREVSSTAVQEKIFVFAHLAPFSGDFDRALEPAYARMLTESGKVEYSIHGHEGVFISTQAYGPPVNYLVVNSLNKRTYLLINVNRDGIKAEQLFF